MTTYEPTPFPYKEGDEVEITKQGQTFFAVITGVSDEHLYTQHEGDDCETEYRRDDLPHIKML